MNKEKTNLVFETAEYVVMEWISCLFNKTVSDMFCGGSQRNTPLYIPKTEGVLYEIQPAVVESNYMADFPKVVGCKKALEAIGFITYCIKAIFLALIQTLKENKIDIIENMGLALDKDRHSFYATFIHPDLLKKEQLDLCISKLLTEMSNNKKSDDWDMNWNITTQQLNILEKSLKDNHIIEDDAKRNEEFKHKKRIGISIREIVDRGM